MLSKPGLPSFSLMYWWGAETGYKLGLHGFPLHFSAWRLMQASALRGQPPRNLNAEKWSPPEKAQDSVLEQENNLATWSAWILLLSLVMDLFSSFSLFTTIRIVINWHGPSYWFDRIADGEPLYFSLQIEADRVMSVPTGRYVAKGGA